MSAAGTGTAGRRMLGRRAGALALGLALACAQPAAGTLREGRAAGHDYLLYAPDTAPVPAAVVLALHGCSQSADAFRRVTRLERLADAEGFVAIFPQAVRGLDNPQRCWRWWDAEAQRGGGEVRALLAVVEQVASGLALDPQRVYALGLSSGGAMAALIAALHPESIAAAAVHSGLPYAAASTTACALAAMRGGALGPRARAVVAHHTVPGAGRAAPLLVVHGDEDDTVDADNAGALIEQFAELHDLADDGDGDNDSFDARADRTLEQTSEGGLEFRVRRYLDAGGNARVESVRVQGLGHAWSGGAEGEPWSEPAGPDASALAWRFLRRWRVDGTAPAPGARARCEERRAWNFAHFWWLDTMPWREYRCDPWRRSWRHGYEGVWIAGRCP